jgi:hydroxyacylglutathione hydrolase
MIFRQVFDEKLAQYAYLVACERTGEAILVDPERDVDRYIRLAEREGVRIVAVAETHIHADFLSGARELADRYGARLFLSGAGGEDWRYEWIEDGDYDVRLLADGDDLSIGEIRIDVLHTPGHTPEHLSLLVTDGGGGADRPMGLLTGDFVFVGDLGRPDLLESAAGMAGEMEPAARRLFHSAERFLELPDHAQVWPGHGAGSACGKSLGAVPQSTVGYERFENGAIRAMREGEEAFVQEILSDQTDPPLYFARMKRLNQHGVPPLGPLPVPRPLAASDVGPLAARLTEGEVAVIDTRVNTRAFMRRHLPGSLYAPLERAFPTDVGSVLDDPGLPIYLVLEEGRVEEAVRDLVRIGFDRIEGTLTPETLEAFFGGDEGERTGTRAAIPEIDFDELERERHDEGALVLDVRYGTEHAEAHVPGAMNVAYTRLPERLREIPADRTLLVHCSTGVRSAVAAAYLAREGRSVKYVGGRFSRWRKEHGEAGAGR